jgi:hypothetical protein
MKNQLTAFATFCLSVTLSVAQIVDKPSSLGSFSTTTALSNEALFTVLGAYAGSGKPGSEASVIQTGNGNSANLNLNGAGNVVNASQKGNSNAINMSYDGTNSRYILDQDGNSNTLNLNKITSSGINFQVIQKDNNNGITVDGTSTGSLPALKIEQTGGMQINITSNAFFVKP